MDDVGRAHRLLEGARGTEQLLVAAWSSFDVAAHAAHAMAARPGLDNDLSSFDALPIFAATAASGRDVLAVACGDGAGSSAAPTHPGRADAGLPADSIPALAALASALAVVLIEAAEVASATRRLVLLDAAAYAGEMAGLLAHLLPPDD